jgi:hypothetical protein
MRRSPILAVLALLLLAGASPAAELLWEDTFEGDPCGDVPAAWTSFGGNDDMGCVWNVGSLSCQGRTELGFYGLVGGCWAAGAATPVSRSEVVYVDTFELELSVRSGYEPVSGCHGGARAYVGLSTGTNWADDERGILYIDATGNVTGPGGVVLAASTLGVCHHAIIGYTRVSPTEIQLQYDVDGNLQTLDLEAAAFEDQLKYLHIGSLEGSTWFDDLSVTREPIALGSMTWGKVKGQYHADED